MAEFVRTLFTSAIVRTAAYAVILLVGFSALFYVFPDIQSAVYRQPAPGSGSYESFGDALSVSNYARNDSRESQALVAFALLIASLLFVAPIAWTYMVTKRQEGFERTFVQVLFLLPIVVAAVVRVVRGDLALAFALAGIVAAVRFRTTLKDLKNAVYAFAAIAIGLAAGTGAFMLAGVLSFFFCLVALLLWRFNIGSLVTANAERSGAMRLAELLVPGERRMSVAIGASPWVDDLNHDQIVGLRENAEKIARFVRGDALLSSNKYKVLLIAFAASAEDGRKVVEESIEDYAERWHLVEEQPAREDAVALEYLIRPRDEAEIRDLLYQLRIGEEGSPILAAQFKNLKGLRHSMK